MIITFRKDIEGDVYQRFLYETPTREDVIEPDIMFKGISKGYYEHDIDGLTDALMNDLVRDMKEQGIEPKRLSNQYLWIEGDRCDLELKVTEDYVNGEKKDFGRIPLPGQKGTPHYSEIWPLTSASGTISYESLSGNNVEPMLEALQNQGYEVRMKLLTDHLQELGSNLKKSKGELTLNIYTEGSG